MSLEDELRQARAESEERGRMLFASKQAIEALQQELEEEKASAMDLQTQAGNALEAQEANIQELEAQLQAALERQGDGSGYSEAGAEANQLRESLMAVQLQLSNANEELAKRHGQTIRLESQLREKTAASAEYQAQAQARQQGMDEANARADELSAIVAEKDALLGEFVETITAVEAEKQQFMGEAAALRAELEQAVGDRRELAGQVRALLEEKARAAQELAKGEGELAREREGREQFQHRVREQVELRLGVLQARVEELASRDTLLLGKLADSANQVGAARAAMDTETARRRDAEATLREATDMYKRELWEKQEELRGLAMQLHQLRDWHGRFMEALGHDVSRATARIFSQPQAEMYAHRASPPRHYSPPRTYAAPPHIVAPAPTEYMAPPEPSHRYENAYRAAGPRPVGSFIPQSLLSAGGSNRPSGPAAAAAALLELTGQKPPEVENELRRLRRIRQEYQTAIASQEPLRTTSSTRPRGRSAGERHGSSLFPSDASKELGGGWGSLSQSHHLGAATGTLLKDASVVTGRDVVLSASGAGWHAAILSKLGMAAAALDAKLGNV